MILTYVLNNEAPLALSAGSDNVTEHFIPGKSILGYLAACYLRQNGKSADDNDFRALFLDETTKYCNAYPFSHIPQENESISSDNMYYPVPEYLCKTKKSGRFFNRFRMQLNEPEEDPGLKTENGNQPKRLKGKFVRIRENIPEVLEASFVNNYHHTSRRNSSSGKNPELYVLEVLEDDQYWAGQITTKKKYVPFITEHLQYPVLGKSKTAQYGSCHLVWGHIDIANPKRAHFDTNHEYLLLTFLSDAVFVGNNGYTVYQNEVEDIVLQKLQELLDDNRKDTITSVTYEPGDLKPYSILQTKMCYGYNSTWNLRKEPFPAIAAGSCIVFAVRDNPNLPRYGFLGEKNQEGYGQFRIEQLSLENYTEPVSNEPHNCGEAFVPEYSKKILAAIKTKKKSIMMPPGVTRLGVSASALGRVSLMLKESMEKHPQKPSDIYNDFEARVKSIKSQGVRDELNKKILEKIKPEDASWPWQWLNCLEMEKYNQKTNSSSTDYAGKKMGGEGNGQLQA